MTNHIDTAPAVPFDLAAVGAGATVLDPDLTRRIRDDATAAAARDVPYVDPFDASPAMREVCDDPGGGRMVAAARLWRAAYRDAGGGEHQ